MDPITKKLLLKPLFRTSVKTAVNIGPGTAPPMSPNRNISVICIQGVMEIYYIQTYKVAILISNML